MQGLYTIQDYPNPLILYFVLLPYLCISQGNHILILSLNVISFLKDHSELCPPSRQHNLFFSLNIQNIMSFLRRSKHLVLHYAYQNIRCCIMHSKRSVLHYAYQGFTSTWAISLHHRTPVVLFTGNSYWEQLFCHPLVVDISIIKKNNRFVATFIATLSNAYSGGPNNIILWFRNNL